MITVNDYSFFLANNSFFLGFKILFRNKFSYLNLFIKDEIMVKLLFENKFLRNKLIFNELIKNKFIKDEFIKYKLIFNESSVLNERTLLFKTDDFVQNVNLGLSIKNEFIKNVYLRKLILLELSLKGIFLNADSFELVFANNRFFDDRANVNFDKINSLLTNCKFYQDILSKDFVCGNIWYQDNLFSFRFTVFFNYDLLYQDRDFLDFADLFEDYDLCETQENHEITDLSDSEKKIFIAKKSEEKQNRLYGRTYYKNVFKMDRRNCLLNYNLDQYNFYIRLHNDLRTGSGLPEIPERELTDSERDYLLNLTYAEQLIPVLFKR